MRVTDERSMQFANHGLIASERCGIGATIWSASASDADGLAVFGAAEADSEMSAARHGSDFVRSLPEIPLDFLPAANKRYVRYQPRNQKAFARLCSKAMTYGGMGVICAPSEIRDQDAVSALEDFWNRAEEINLRAIARRTTAKIFMKRPISTARMYVVGFYFDTPISVLLSADEDRVERVSKLAVQNSNFSVIERW